jgi:hypothetical protein
MYTACDVQQKFKFRLPVGRGDLIFCGWHLIFVDFQYGSCFVTLLVPRILMWLLDLWKACAPIMCTHNVH